MAMKRLFARPKSREKSASPGPASPSTPSVAGVPTPSLQPKFVVPPLPHPCPHDHLALLVTQHGLLLRPHVINYPNPASHVRIDWGMAGRVQEVQGSGEEDGADWQDSVIVYGIVGLMKLFSASYLLVVTATTEVGHLFHESRTIYGVKSVTAIPLDHDRARIAVNTLASRNAAAARPSLIVSTPSTAFDISHVQSITEEPEETDEEGTSGSIHVKFANEEQVKMMSPTNTHEFASDQAKGLPTPPSPNSSGASTPTSDNIPELSPVAKTLAARLSFWSRLSKRTSQSDDDVFPESLLQEAESLDAVFADNKERPEEVIESILAATAPPPATAEERHSELEDKIVRECIREFTKGDMYLSYTFDLTKSLQHKQEQIAKTRKEARLLLDLTDESSSNAIAEEDYKVDVLSEPQPTLPLWRRVDRQFWWNEMLSEPFVSAGLHSYVLPIMQGFVQIASFNVPREPEDSEEGLTAAVDYVIVSRRSRDRAGLRYQRRGVDDEAHVANFVETETIVRLEREGKANVFSYVQIRGSIPLYWTQSGYSLKPAPTMSTDRTHEQNLDALRRHFKKTVPLYGPHTVVNLAEQHGKEAPLTDAYRQYMEEMDWKDAQYHQYDFHAETKGMKYENISKLIDSLERVFDSQGFLWISNDLMMSQQKGVFRVNCIDCLDRTNVVQSAFARHMLNRNLGAVALLNPIDVGKTETDVVFNDVWANNGDAISRAYAGTSALKGDFTRTGKRDLGGMLNDGMNSLARMYTSTFSDWFCQAVIDFMLGYRTLSVFSEFLLKLQSSDPRDLIRISKIRAEAIATAVSRVLPEGERLLSGWTLFAPVDLNTKVGDKFEEKVLLLSAKALYIVSYDYNLEKVKMYARVPLGDIIGVKKGAYILSPLEEASRDPVQNAGFMVSYVPSGQTTRVSSYSVRNSAESLRKSITPSTPMSQPKQFVAKTNAVLAKILPISSGNSLPTDSKPSSFKGISSRPGTNRRASVLSKILSNALPPPDTDVTFAAFKALPVDPARIRRGSGSFADGGEDQTGASTSQEAVDVMVDAIKRACEDVGNIRANFVTEEDVVSLADAQRMTTVYAKMEYGVKRLLWLGGG